MLQLEVFYELNASAINTAARAAATGASLHEASHGSHHGSHLSAAEHLGIPSGRTGSEAPAGHKPSHAGSTPYPSDVFKTSEDRQFLLAVILHCADISNAAKPMAIAEKYVCLALCERNTVTWCC